MMRIRPSLAAIALLLAASPLAGGAQTLTPDPLPPSEEAPGIIEQGLKRLLEGLFTEMEPALRDLGGTLQAYEPMMRELAALISDLENYQSPERLPNGDILLRRKPGAPPAPPIPDTAGPKSPERPAPFPRSEPDPKGVPEDEDTIDL